MTILLLAILLSGCRPEYQCNVPIGDAACQLELMQYPNLIGGKGYEYIVAGYQGVVVIRTSISEYAAYERTCPYDEGRLEVSADYGNTVLECPQCHSRFNAFAGGVPVEGSLTSCSLYQYSAVADGGVLYIGNY